MSLVNRAQRDMQKITGNINEFGVNITVKTPDGSAEAAVVGLNTKHHMAFDVDGVMVNTKTASVGIAEQQLIDGNFPNIRNAAGDVNLNKTLVDVEDSTGVVKSYVAHRVYPDEYLGLLIFILGDYSPAT